MVHSIEVQERIARALDGKPAQLAEEGAIREAIEMGARLENEACAREVDELIRALEWATSAVPQESARSIGGATIKMLSGLAKGIRERVQK